MALQFILGASGTGKTKYLYDTIAGLAAENADTTYYFIVPEQFTLQLKMLLLRMLRLQLFLLSTEQFMTMVTRSEVLPEHSGRNLPIMSKTTMYRT